ncbi:hypothetical protein [Actinopolyspora erythraea]|uniref:hypothetical protein n=1 Tax=Actinopolyspora erythraea TaxID=414996 RepID=UPI0011856950|nr:hypothetical protein [Actinopolyspora erythraea]
MRTGSWPGPALLAALVSSGQRRSASVTPTRTILPVSAACREGPLPARCCSASTSITASSVRTTVSGPSAPFSVTPAMSTSGTARNTCRHTRSSSTSSFSSRSMSSVTVSSAPVISSS